MRLPRLAIAAYGACNVGNAQSMIVNGGGESREDAVAAALRLALAEKLHIDPDQLEGLDSEAAAAALQQFIGFGREHEQLPEWPARRGDEEEGTEVVADGIRQALAYELRVDPQRLERMNVVGAAHALDRIRSRRMGAHTEVVALRSAATEDARSLVERMLQSALADQLKLPVEAVSDVRPELAARIVAHLLSVRRQMDERSLPAPAPDEMQDRRNLVARVVRDVIAQDLDVHPRALGALDPAVAAILLGRFTEARRTMEILRSHVAIDELTSALRRSAGEAALEREIARVRRTPGAGLVVAFLDVDSLKTINDTRGHHAGDEVLRAMAMSLEHRLRAYDTVIRWGGDEFLVILPQTDSEAAGMVMAQVLDFFKERTEGLSFSFGLAALQGDETAGHLVHRADSRLLEAKAERQRAEQTPEEEPAPAGGEGAEAGEGTVADLDELRLPAQPAPPPKHPWRE